MRVWYDGSGAWLISPGENEQERRAVSAFFAEANQHGRHSEIGYISSAADRPASLMIGGVQLVLGASHEWCQQAIDALDDSHDLVFLGHVGALPPHGSIQIAVKGHKPQFPLVL